MASAPFAIRTQIVAALVFFVSVATSASAQGLVDEIRKAKARALEPATHDWPAWRGLNGLGIRSEPLPVTLWTNTKGVRWKAAIPGEGHASPIVVGDCVFVCTADRNLNSRTLICHHRDSGALLWKTVYHTGGFMYKNEKNSHASATPVCDGKHVFIPYIADDALWLSAIHVDGKPAWQKKLGPFASEWGYASSPVLYNDLVIVVGDNKGSSAAAEPEATSYLVAVHRTTGDIVWRVSRPLSASYGSPIIAKIAGRDQLLISGAQRIVSYDPMTGDEFWFCRWSARRSANSLAVGPDCVVASTTWPNTQMVCVRADGMGDVTDTHVAWKHSRTLNDIPSALFHEGRVFSVTDRGMVICMDGQTGKPIWQDRIGGAVSASPVLVGASIIATDEDGNSTLFKAGAQFEPLGKNSLGERVLASPAVSGDYLFLRSARSLWCIDGKSTLPTPVMALPKTPVAAPILAPTPVKGSETKQADSSDVSFILWIAIAALAVLTFLAALLLGLLLLKDRLTAPVQTTRLAKAPVATKKAAPEFVTFACSACGRKLKVKQGPAGKKVKCPHCTAIVQMAAAS